MCNYVKKTALMSLYVVKCLKEYVYWAKRVMAYD